MIDLLNVLIRNCFCFSWFICVQFNQNQITLVTNYQQCDDKTEIIYNHKFKIIEQHPRKISSEFSDLLHDDDKRNDSNPRWSYPTAKAIWKIVINILKIMRACEVTIGISISFCSVRIERFIRRNDELIMAPDCSFEENVFPHLAGHNVFKSTGSHVHTDFLIEYGSYNMSHVKWVRLYGSYYMFHGILYLKTR